MLIIYAIAGYWAAGVVLYNDKIIVETAPFQLFGRKLIFGVAFGFILIPIAIIKKILSRQSKTMQCGADECRENIRPVRGF